VTRSDECKVNVSSDVDIHTTRYTQWCRRVLRIRRTLWKTPDILRRLTSLFKPSAFCFLLSFVRSLQSSHHITSSSSFPVMRESRSRSGFKSRSGPMGRIGLRSPPPPLAPALGLRLWVDALLCQCVIIWPTSVVERRNCDLRRSPCSFRSSSKSAVAKFS